MIMPRLPVNKTPKCYVGGKFIRSESGRTNPWHDAKGRFAFHVPACTRKDVRHAVEAAAAAVPGWSSRTGYNRGQILYRLAEMMESRAPELAASLALAGETRARAAAEVARSTDALVHHAGWADKFEQVLGSVNPVAGPYFNFTTCEPCGVAGLVLPDSPALLPLIALTAAAIVSGNAVVALASHEQPAPALLLGEILAVSDLPGGVVNLLTGSRADMLATLASHHQVRVVSGQVPADDHQAVDEAAAAHVARVRLLPRDTDWDTDPARHGLDRIRDFVEFKTTWHPVGG